MRNTSYSTPHVYAQPAARSALSGKLLLMTLFLPLAGYAQTAREVSGKVTDGTGTGLPGVTVLVTGTALGTSTGADGGFSLQVPATATSLTVSFIGYAKQTVPITGRNTVTVKLQDDAQALSDVVVVGYGTVQKKDLTGAVSALGPKEFNKGTFTSPDQLIQGRASGVQVTQNSGQPGGAATIKIRGNSAVTGTGQPLYVVDGVPLDGRSARPGFSTGSLGDSPDSNPLNFINPNDIESIDVLKDASATAIYGSRAAYGVVIITTKKGKTGVTRLDVGASGGFSHIMRRIKVLDASQYRDALTYYGAPANNDKGGDVDALGAILRTAPLQNYSAAVSGGNESGRYRLSLGYLDQQGIVKKSGFKKYSANFSTNLTFLDSKKLGLDVNIIATQTREQLAPITNNAGFQGSLIGQALQWNPTNPLYNADGTPNSVQGSTVNPVAQLDYYNDNSRVTTALASVSPYYKFTDWLTYRLLISANYSTGIRRTDIGPQLPFPDYQKFGFASIATSELVTQQLTQTLNFNKNVTPDLSVNALLGYEYQQFDFSNTFLGGLGPAGGFPAGLDPTNIIQNSNAAGRIIRSYADPSSKLQSVFGRAVLNYRQRYLLTGTLRTDGSTKFGSNNRYGWFPSVSAAWDISQESFFKFETVNQLKVRAGYGRTGNQEFPAGSSQKQYTFDNNGIVNQSNNANANLRWQSDQQYDAGVDVALFNNRLTLTADYFYKKTTGLLFPTVPVQPGPSTSTVTWQNLEGAVVNKGVELLVGVTAVDNQRFGVNISANATFIRNRVSGLPAPIFTGALNGQGLSNVLSETIANGSPINSFYLQQFTGIDPTTGLAGYGDNGIPTVVGNPNPTTLAGLSTTFRFEKLSLIANFNGVFGNQIYNNTLNSVLNVGQIRASKNIALLNYQSALKESLSNPVAPSSRFLESGNYVRLSNVTLSYALGDVGKIFKGASIYAIGQNLFVITNYNGFDPQVNTNKTVGAVPSVGIDYAGYPTARIFTFGVNFSL